MGLTQSVYVVGEVDCHVVDISFQRYWAGRHSVRLRWPKVTFVQPATLEFDRDVTAAEVPSVCISCTQETCHRCLAGCVELRDQNQVRAVLLSATRNVVTGSLTAVDVLGVEAIVDVKPYGLK